MTRLLRCSLLVGFVGLFAAIGCGDDEAEDDGAGAQGATGAEGGSGGSGNEGGSTGGGAGCEVPPECTAVTVDQLKLTSFSEEDPRTGAMFGAGYSGVPMPGLGAAGDDLFRLEFYDAAATGTIDLGTGDQTNYKTCKTCVLAIEDLSEDGPPAKIYFQAAGSLALGSTTPPFVSGELTCVKLVEVEVDFRTYESTPVEGGSCLFLASAELDIPPPPMGWECPPQYYDADDGCDCACGALDPDCSDPTLDVFGCEEGQTCSADGLSCEGVPTAWTCAADQYDGGAGNGCDCNCGTSDPDCDIAAEPVEGCQAGEMCSVVGGCYPAAWTCDPTYYGDALCDCGCGVLDVDCPDALVGSCGYCDNEGSCSTTACPGTINPTNNAVCG